MNAINYRRSADGRTFVPDLHTEEPTGYGKYGHMRLKYLKRYRQDQHMIYLMQGILNQHLAETDVKAKEMVEEMVKKLLEKHPAPDRNNILAWTGHMNSLKRMAEEVVYQELIYV